MTMSHTLPSPDDRPAYPMRPDGSAWELDDFLEYIPLLDSLSWNDAGVVHLPGFFPGDWVDDYKDEWIRNNGPIHQHQDGMLCAPNIGGYNETGYLRHRELMAICTDDELANQWQEYLGEPAGVHLNLTGWVSTQRNWHSDYYLNEECVGDYYGAIWVALDDVHPDSGPFEYFPGSHLWHGVVTKQKIGKAVDIRDPRWPAHSEEVLAPLIEAEAARRGVKKVVYLPQKGDVLMWHGRLYHRGSKPNIENHYRGALIAHYSGIDHRQDMPIAVKHPEYGGFYFPLGPLGEGV